jgi:hypothetical protein
VKGNEVASKKTRRVIAFSAFAVAAAAGPILGATAFSSSAPQDYRALPPGCLAWYGNQEDGKCLSYSNGSPTNIGTPWGIFGPNNYNNTTLLPGQTITGGIN